MALPAKKKRGLRFLEHEGTRYYWRVKNDYAKAELDILIGLEAQPSRCFHVRVGFVDPSLYFSWFAAAQAQGRDANEINEPESIGPKFVTEAIGFANTQSWREKKKFVVHYKNGTFGVP